MLCTRGSRRDTQTTLHNRTSPTKRVDCGVDTDVEDGNVRMTMHLMHTYSTHNTKTAPQCVGVDTEMDTSAMWLVKMDG